MEQPELLRVTLQILEGLQIPYALVGSYGSSIFGEPRFTRDIDILIELPGVESLRIPCRISRTPIFTSVKHAVRDAVRGRFQFNLLHPASGNKVDFILPPRRLLGAFPK